MLSVALGLTSRMLIRSVDAMAKGELKGLLLAVVSYSVVPFCHALFGFLLVKRVWAQLDDI
jgi:hypothetical protein